MVYQKQLTISTRAHGDMTDLTDQLTAAVAEARVEVGGATMKIARVGASALRLPVVNERCGGSQETLVVKFHTDAGLVGIGEAGSSALVAKAIIEAPLSHKICRGLAECVGGEDPFEIDRLIHRMYEGSIFFGRQGAAI